MYSHGKTTEQFVLEAIEIHGPKYDYSLVDYINNTTPVKIICFLHGIFEQIPRNHLYLNHGCPSCAYFKNLERVRKEAKEKFLKEAIEIHGDRFDYSLVDYINGITNVKIRCKKHNYIFLQRPGSHIRSKYCCPKCNKSFKSNTDDFIRKAKLVHGDLYDYSLVNYINSHTKVKIKCPIHGVFEQLPTSHLNGSGCEKCKASTGEIAVRKYLKEKCLFFIEQKKFTNCVNKRKLTFDFYLPGFFVCIEFQGVQHYKPVKFFAGSKRFKELQERDQIKRDFCKKSGIKLIAIPYWDKENLGKYLDGF